MTESHVVTCFLEHEDKILVFRRSNEVGTYRGHWAGISGFIDPTNSDLEQAFIELWEETGLEPQDVVLVCSGEPLTVVDHDLGKKWVVHPFRFRLTDPSRVKLDWEHTESRWVVPEEIKILPTVPMLYEAWERVR